MKLKILHLLTICLLVIFSANAEILTVSYEDGLEFPIGEIGTLDVDFDGNPDVQIDNNPGYINLYPMTLSACLSLEYTTTFASGKMLRTFEEGQEVDNDTGNPQFGFEDWDDNSLLKDDGTLYDGWADLEERYIGFMNFATSSTGWIKVKIDMATQTLIVLSQGYETVNTETIIAGDAGVALVAPDFDYTIDQDQATFVNNSTNADSYHWTFGDGNESFEENPSHTYANSGFYDVCLLATNVSGSETICKTIAVVVSGIEDFYAESIQLYPNPSQAEAIIAFELNKTQDIAISIFDAKGALVLDLASQNYDSGAHTLSIPVSHLDAGHYFVNFRQGSEVLKVLKLQKTE